MNIRNIVGFIILLLSACRPELPETSSIVIDLDRPISPVNKDLYGVTLEEINHAVEGGIYAELIRNRSFEEGVVPAGCFYNALQNCIVTPAGWKIPFVRPNAIPGWRPLSEHTLLLIDTRIPLNEENRRSLFVKVALSGKGGVVAEGFRGIALVRGEQYDLSFYIRGDYGKSVSVMLCDTNANMRLSNPYRVSLPDEWKRFHHTFTATDSARCATLVFEVDSGVSFNLDVVSLFPRKTWKNRPNGLRSDLMDAVAALNPKFVRFPGGAFVESYAGGMVPNWKETIGALESRKPLWSIWGYGTTNGVGFHEYLQLCEDLNAFPIYVMSTGLLNQRYHTRYDDIKNIYLLAERAESAMAYANSPATDSVFGSMRADNGHPESFGLSHVALGDENSGAEYGRRYRILRQAIKDTFPHVTLIGTDSSAVNGFYDDWIDNHYTMGVDNLITMGDCFDSGNMNIRTPMSFTGSFGAAFSNEGGTMRAAVGEAAFLVGIEHAPMKVKGVSYSPLLGHTGFHAHGTAAILFDASRMAKTPSYHVLEMFASNRGNELLATKVNTYCKPLVTYGRASIVLSGNDFEVRGVKMNGVEQPLVWVNDERTNIKLPEMKKPLNVSSETTGRSGNKMRKARSNTLKYSGQRQMSSDNRSRRFQMFGDPMAYNYHFSAIIKRVQEGGFIRLNVRDNGLVEERCDCLSLIIEDSVATLYHCAGTVRRPLGKHAFVSLKKDEWAAFEIKCEDEMIRCYMNDVLLIEAAVPSKPSLVAVATCDMETKTVILKVVNTTLHEEWTSLRIDGGKVADEAELIQLSGRPESRNTLEHPNVVIPIRKKIKLLNRYAFPANSVTILIMKIK